MAALTKKEIARIIDEQLPGFRVAADQTVPHRRGPVPGAAVTPELNVVRKRFANVPPRKAAAVRRVGAPPKDAHPGFDQEDNIAVIIEPKDGDSGPGPKSVLIDPKSQKIISSQGQAAYDAPSPSPDPSTRSLAPSEPDHPHRC